MNSQPFKMMPPLLRILAFTFWAWSYFRAPTHSVPSVPDGCLTRLLQVLLEQSCSQRGIPWSLYVQEQLCDSGLPIFLPAPFFSIALVTTWHLHVLLSCSLLSLSLHENVSFGSYLCLFVCVCFLFVFWCIPPSSPAPSTQYKLY